MSNQAQHVEHSDGFGTRYGYGVITGAPIDAFYRDPKGHWTKEETGPGPSGGVAASTGAPRDLTMAEIADRSRSTPPGFLLDATDRYAAQLLELLYELHNGHDERALAISGLLADQCRDQNFTKSGAALGNIRRASEAMRAWAREQENRTFAVVRVEYSAPFVDGKNALVRALVMKDNGFVLVFERVELADTAQATASTLMQRGRASFTFLPSLWHQATRHPLAGHHVNCDKLTGSTCTCGTEPASRVAPNIRPPEYVAEPHPHRAGSE